LATYFFRNLLVLAAAGKSAVFTGHVVGSATINATASSLTRNSGTLTVLPGPVAGLKIENAADGSGTVIAGPDIASSTGLTAYALAIDSSGNLIGNVAASWSLTSITGGVVSGDLVPAADNKSAVLTGHAAGGAVIRATAGNLAPNTGTFTVVPTISFAEYLVPTSASQLTSIITGPDNNLWFAENNGGEIGRLRRPESSRSFRLPPVAANH
jgi:hypothetical protein